MDTQEYKDKVKQLQSSIAACKTMRQVNKSVNILASYYGGTHAAINAMSRNSQQSRQTAERLMMLERELKQLQNEYKDLVL